MLVVILQITDISDVNIHQNCNCVIQEIEQFRKDLRGDFPDPDSPSLDTDVKVAFRFPSGSVMKYDFHSNADTKVRSNELFVMNIINNIYFSTLVETV